MQAQPLQSYQGFYDATGIFRTSDGLPVPRKGQAVLMFIDNPLQYGKANEQLEAFDEFMSSIHGSGEEIPVFERAQLHREVEL